MMMYTQNIQITVDGWVTKTQTFSEVGGEKNTPIYFSATGI